MSKSNKKFNKSNYNKKYKDQKPGTTGSDARMPNVKGRKPNDPTWYAKNDQLLKDVASLPFSNVLGLRNPINTTLSDRATNLFFPGILAMNYAHSLGCGQFAVDAPTVAARFLYTFVRHKNSGSVNYESPDMMMAIIAWHSLCAYLEEGKRAYGTLLNYSTRNRYFAETVIQAMGFDYEDLKENMVSFRASLNQLCAQLNSIKVPGSMPLGMRWNQLAREYYIDGKSAKSQLYIPKCQHFFKFEGYKTETGSSLTAVVWDKPVTTAEYLRTANQMLAVLVSEEDIGIMSGDIMKSFGDDVTSVSLIAEDYRSMPIESDEMLYQIHNSFCLGTLANNEVIQENGVIKHNVRYLTDDDDTDAAINIFAANKMANQYMLNVFFDGVTPSEVMTFTRLIPGTIKSVSDVAATQVTSGSEILISYTLYTAPHEAVPNNTVTFGSVISDANKFRYVYSILCALDWHPRIYLAEYDEPNEEWAYIGQCGEIDNYTFVPSSVIDNMHHVAILSEVATSSHTSI